LPAEPPSASGKALDTNASSAIAPESAIRPIGSDRMTVALLYGGSAVVRR
jgi:hypothetical protein